MNESILCDSTGETAAQVATEVFTRHGFRVIRSFDLRSAMAAHAVCECPHHGTAQCTCQFVVLLVYGESGAPVVVTTHSRDAQAQMQIVRDANARPDPHLVEQIRATLFEIALVVLPEPAEVSVDAH